MSLNLVLPRWRKSIIGRIEQKCQAINLMINNGCTLGELTIAYRGLEKILVTLLKHLRKQWKIPQKPRQ